MKFKKTLNELEAVSVKWWPKALEEEVAKLSSLPKLIETQDQFISILKLSGDNPYQIFDVIESGSLRPNLFLKHLVVLTDFGGELIKRLGREFDDVFPTDIKTKKRLMQFGFKGQPHSYEFKALPVKGLGNPKLKIDGIALLKDALLDEVIQDLILILLFGGASQASHLASLERCDVGSLLGKGVEIDQYVKEKYLHVSRITTGAGANSLGQVAQQYVAKYLRSKLDVDQYNVKSNGKVPLRSYDSENGMPFDVVVEKDGKIVGIEVSFQVTSNSVIERKASNAEDRKNQMGREGHYVAYVLDGAGNFSRASALSTICQSSDCTVAYSDEEFDTLVDFIRGKLDDSIR